MGDKATTEFLNRGVGKDPLSEPLQQFMECPRTVITEAAYQGTMRAYREIQAANDAKYATDAAQHRSWLEKDGILIRDPHTAVAR